MRYVEKAEKGMMRKKSIKKVLYPKRQALRDHSATDSAKDIKEAK